jgi:hypothetical protein
MMIIVGARKRREAAGSGGSRHERLAAVPTHRLSFDVGGPGLTACGRAGGLAFDPDGTYVVDPPGCTAGTRSPRTSAGR